MNLTIAPINFNSRIYLKKQNNFSNPQIEKFNNYSFEASLALKNQILFKGNSRKDLIQKTIKENHLPIKPQTLDFVLTPPIKKEGVYLKYSKTGSKFFELYSRYLAHNEYPIKDEGELTDIITYFIKGENKARIIKDIVPEELLPNLNNKKETQIAQATCLNALLGAIIYENEDGFKTAFNFLNEKIGENIFPKNLKLEHSPYEKLTQLVKNKGYDAEDIYQETRFFNEQWHYRINFKDIILSQATGEKHNHEIRQNCAIEAIENIESGKINLDDAGDDLNYINYKKPTQKRIKDLEEFSQKWGLKFDNIALLHKAFLYGEMQDGSALAHCDTYETLEYIGDAVLGFCTHEILQDNLTNTPREIICAKRHSFVKNKNLSILAKKMNLANYTINRDKAMGEKRTADMFEALIGAIFLDGKENGINNVYNFLDKNFRNEICNSIC